MFQGKTEVIGQGVWLFGEDILGELVEGGLPLMGISLEKQNSLERDLHRCSDQEPD